MNQRDRIGEIAENKKRNSRWHGLVSFDIESLKTQFENSPETRNGCTDFYLIRCVTFLEVFTRSNIAALVDHSKDYTDRAVELAKNFKMDFAAAQGIQGRAVTLGDIVAHSVPVNQFQQIISHFETLLGKKLRPLLIQAHDRVDVEILQKPKAPIIEDYDQMCERLSHLFEVRHIICHELPLEPVYSDDEVVPFLKAALSFIKAMEEIVSFERFGLTPLTQTEMNVRAYERSNQAWRELDEALNKVRESVQETNMSLMPASVKLTELEAFNDCQEKWKQFAEADAEFAAYENQGGTIWPTIYAGHLTSIIESRIGKLNLWLGQETSAVMRSAKNLS
jgi:Lysozyme inhibitor LprI